jgi:hypothetical protein
MALTKTNSTTTASAFESMDDDVAVLERAEPVAVAAPAVAPAPEPAATQVAVRQSAALVGVAADFAAELDALRAAADFSHGNFKVFKASNGEILNIAEPSEKFGRWVHGTMIGWDDHFEISPSSEDKGSKDYVAYSKDGITIDSVIGEKMRSWVGKKAADYIDFLHNSTDFQDAGSRRFIDVAFVVQAAEETEDFNGEIVQITLAQSSIKSFQQYTEQLKMKALAIKRGIPGIKLPTDPLNFYFIRETASDKGKNWTKLKVSATLPARI